MYVRMCVCVYIHMVPVQKPGDENASEEDFIEGEIAKLRRDYVREWDVDHWNSDSGTPMPSDDEEVEEEAEEEERGQEEKEKEEEEEEV